MADLPLETRLADLGELSPRFLKRLEKLGLITVRDILWHFPFRYEDFSQIYPINNLEPGQHATVTGVIQKIDVRRTWQKRLLIIEAEIADESGIIKAIWFNQPYIKNILRPGRQANFSGKVAVNEQEIYLSHPTYELVTSDMSQETRHTARLVPIYPETRGLTSKGLRSLVQPLLEHVASIPEWLPAEILRMERLPEINLALREIHFPETIESALRAKRRFALENLFLLQLWNFNQKLKLAGVRAPKIDSDLKEIKKIIADLPFTLTFSQKRSLWEIIQDIAKDHPMNRLLQGDVGSGKTVVAAIAALVSARAGFQTAFMAPTEILANQHFNTLQKLLARLPAAYQPPVGLLTATSAKIMHPNDLIAQVKKTDLERALRSGEIKIVIGTHALISPRGKTKERPSLFKELGLVIVDEQHRFGVEQRAKLSQKQELRSKNNRENKRSLPASSFLLPHFLSMSATPIPRTLTLTLFGDLDLSIIDELPLGRKKILTKIVEPSGRAAAYQFVRDQIAQGRQAFVVCPRIETNSHELNTNTNESQMGQFAIGENSYQNSRKFVMEQEVKSVKAEYEKLSKDIFPDLRLAMLHGQMPASSKTRRGPASGRRATKESVMKDFMDGKIDILVSTSVIEVGVDVPNATIILIEGGERFGLAQLYQFRGRVGRGEHESFCLLFTESASRSTNERLKAIVEAKNGFELAEKDLKLRGPGEFLGHKQTGLPDGVMRGLQNMELIAASRRSAVKLLETDRTLARHPRLKEKLKEFQAQIHLE